MTKNNSITIELIQLPIVDITQSGVLRGHKFSDAVKEIIVPQMELNKIYVVTVKSLYVTGRQGKISKRESHFLAKKKELHYANETNIICETSNFPVYTLGRPEELFTGESE